MVTKHMEIREATPSDVDGIRAVADAAWESEYPDVLTRETVTAGVDEWYDEESITEALRVPGATLLVVDDGDGVVGFAHAFRSGATGDILRLYVHPDRQREGIGSDLLEATVDELVSQGVGRVRAMVLADNDRGRSFYESFGFEKVDEGETRIAGETYPEYTYVRTASL